MAQLYGAPASGDRFTDRRRTGIGGSDAGAILGVSPWSSALGVFEQKRGTAPPFQSSERMEWGTRLEGPILARYAEGSGRKVIRGGRRFLRHPDIRFVIGHPDGTAADRIIDAKTTAVLGPEWGEDGSPDVPAVYYAQGQHYLILTGAPRIDFAVLVGGREYHEYSVPANPVFQQELLHEEGLFWQRVIDDDPPEPDGSESAGQALRRMFPRAIPEEVIATPEVVAYAEAYLAADAVMDTAKAERDRWGQLIQRFMGSRERLLGPGIRATWGNRSGSISWKSYSDDLLRIIQMIRAADAMDSETRDAWVGETDAAALARLMEGRRGAPSRVFSLSRRKDDE